MIGNFVFILCVDDAEMNELWYLCLFKLFIIMGIDVYVSLFLYIYIVFMLVFVVFLVSFFFFVL